MNSRRFVVVLLALNILQLGFLVHLRNRPPTSKVFKEITPFSIKERMVEKRVAVTNQFDWHNVESTDYRAYIANLRAVGCPEETVRDIIIADIDKLFAARLRSSLPQPSQHYWQPSPIESSDEALRAAEKQRRQLEREKRALVKELLGADLSAERKKVAAGEDAFDNRFRFLPLEKRERLSGLLNKFSDRESAILERRADDTGVLNDQDRADLKKLREEREAELAAFLTPEEKQLFDYWTSNAGITARHALSGLENPTEQEFQAIYKLQKEFDERWNDIGANGAQGESWQQAHEDLEKKIRAALGEQRYAEYIRGQDLDYRNALDTLQHFQLPKETAVKFYELKKSTLDEISKTFADPTLDETQKEKASDEIRKQAGRQARALLGGPAFERYWNAGNTGWFQIE